MLAGSIVGANGVFLKALYAAGIKGYYDGLAVHYYTLTLASLRSIREVQTANGDTTPLWLTEFGWSSCWPRYRLQQEQACVTPQTQALNITNIFRSLARTPYIAAETLYQAAGIDRGKLRGPECERHPQAGVRSALARARLSVRPRQPGHPEPAQAERPGGRERLGPRRRLHGARSLPRQRPALPRPVRAEPLQPLLGRLPSVLGTSGLRVRVYISTGRGSVRPRSARSDQRHQLLI